MNFQMFKHYNDARFVPTNIDVIWGKPCPHQRLSDMVCTKFRRREAWLMAMATRAMGEFDDLLDVV